MGLGSITREVRAASGNAALAVAAFALQRTGRAAVAVIPRPGTSLDDVFRCCVRAVGAAPVRVRDRPCTAALCNGWALPQLPARNHWFLHGQRAGGTTVLVSRTRTGKVTVEQTPAAPAATPSPPAHATAQRSASPGHSELSAEAARELLWEAARASAPAPRAQGPAPVPTDSLGAALLCARFEAARGPTRSGRSLAVAAVLRAAGEDAEEGADARTVHLLRRAWRAEQGAVSVAGASAAAASSSARQASKPTVPAGAASAVQPRCLRRSALGPVTVSRVQCPGDTPAGPAQGAPWRVPMLRCVDADLRLVLGRCRSSGEGGCREEWFAFGACHGGCVVAVCAGDGGEAWRVQVGARVHTPVMPVVGTGTLLVAG